AEVQSLLDQLAAARPRPPDYDHRRAMLQTFVGLLHMYDGRFVEACSWFGKAGAENLDLAREVRANLLALRGIAALRRGEIETGGFVNVAPSVGLDTRGPNMLGGSAFDDFNGDGRPDILVLSGDWDRGGSLFINRGDGTFEDRGESAGLADQKMAVNLVHADY